MRGAKPRVLILVSKQDHCLNDLLYRSRIGALPMERRRRSCRTIATRASSRRATACRSTICRSRRDQGAQEAKLAALIDGNGTELVVLARYMQVLSDGLARELAGRAINIHHRPPAELQGREALPPGATTAA